MDYDVLLSVLNTMLGRTIERAEYETIQLHGGTLGDVKLVAGNAYTAQGEKMPYKVVWKTQKKWERFGDVDSWRREYDLYNSSLGAVFTDALRWPKCYHSKITPNEIQLWMEYVQGASGSALTVEMLEAVAMEMGRFQGKLLKKPQEVRSIACLADADFTQREFSQWHRQQYSYEFLISPPCRMEQKLKDMLIDRRIRLFEGKSFEYSCLRSGAFGIPAHLTQMLTDTDEQSETIFAKIRSLPVVLCHRDLWIENVFYTKGGIRLIDWDTCGWGYLGEDIATLIADGTSPEMMEVYYHRLVRAYLQGISQYMEDALIERIPIHEMICIKFGYRFAQGIMFAPSDTIHQENLDLLQKLYDLREI